MRKKISIIIDLLIIISSGLGIYLTIGGINFMNQGALLYYTVQSNIYILVISAIFLLFKLLEKKIPQYLYIIKFICTVGITVTFLVFTFMLVPQMFGGFNEYLLSLGNLTVHFISPILAVISFIIFDKVNMKKYTFLYGSIMPIVYCIFIMILTTIKKEPLFGGLGGTMSRFPYFFMDYETNGWFRINNSIWELGFFYWFLIILIVVIIISKLYLRLSNKKRI